MSEPTQEAFPAKTWTKYFDARSGSGGEARPLLLRTLGMMKDAGYEPGVAVDLGCGEGTDTEHLLRTGWRVVAVDGSEEGVERTAARAEALNLSDSLDARAVPFEKLDELPAADLVFAAVSLPFCPPAHFGDLWQAVRNSVGGRGGWIAAQFFGPNDTWADNPGMTIHTRKEVEQLFAGMDVRVFDERDEDGQAVSGPKHWHVFDVIAASGPANS